MRVTAITIQQKDPNRVNVMIDGKYRFSLDVAQVVDLKLKTGKEYTEDELLELETESQFGRLYARTLEYCFMRPHSAKEVRDYLYRKTLTKKYRSKKTGELKARPGVDKVVVDRVFDRLVEKGYVDDEKFANFWVENRNQRKGISRRMLHAELRRKGVDQAVIESCFAALVRNDVDEIQKIIAKKRARYSDDKKLIQYLARQGFLYDDIKASLELSTDD